MAIWMSWDPLSTPITAVQLEPLPITALLGLVYKGAIGQNTVAVNAPHEYLRLQLKHLDALQWKWTPYQVRG